MPGPYRGQVVEVRHPTIVRPPAQINPQAVRVMLAQAMCELTGTAHADDAWRQLFGPGDVVGLKVNPVGVSLRSGVVGAISSHALVVAIVRGLKSAGVASRDIILFDRYAREFIDAGYADLIREPDLLGCRWLTAGTEYSGTQVNIDGVERPRSAYSPDLLRGVVGYDPNVFVALGYASPEHHPKDDRRFRSHVTRIVSQMVNKIINVPVLKDHRSAGVTLALKNLSHGLHNNVARSHLAGIAHGQPDLGDYTALGPNQCNTFIPHLVQQPLIRSTVVLHILDGLVGVYEGGPGTWNATWATWNRGSLLVATDPVALDWVGWQIIDAERRRRGWPMVAEMGRTQSVRAFELAGVGHTAPWSAVAQMAAGQHRLAGRRSEVFERRQPEHITLAGTLGLGTCVPSEVRHRCVGGGSGG
jgi:hypothetical protein